MIQKIFDTIQLQDIKELVVNQVAENKTLEYKSIVKLDKDADKKEFLYDISSFANATGGDLLFGISEGKEKGLPGSLDGIDGTIDEQCRKMESLIRDCISPRILNILMKPILLDNGKSLLFVRIPKSLNAPHQVTFQGVDRFYSRSNNGKYVLDVFEIKNAFLQASQFTEKIKSFIKGRIANINANETPVPLENNPKIVLHIIPLQSVEEGSSIISNQDLKKEMLFPLGSGGYDYRYNLEGVLNFSKLPGDKESSSYVQLYRNGIVESVNADLLREYNDQKLISVSKSFSVEGKIIQFVTDALKLLQKMEVETPMYLFLHLLSVKGYGIGSDRLRLPVFGEKGIDKDSLQLPEVIIQNYPSNTALLLRDWFETIWNSAGYEKCYSYDDTGNFTGF